MTDSPAPQVPESGTAAVRKIRTRAALAVSALVGLGVVLCVGLGLWWQLSGPAPLAAVSAVTLALPLQINAAPAQVAFSQGLFEQATVHVVNQPFLLGKDALRSVLDGKADLAVVADTPFMHSVLAGNDVSALAGISQARRALAIVARTDRGIHAVKDLTGKTVALSLGTNMPYFLDAMLQAAGVPSDKVDLQDKNVAATLRAMKDGSADAAVMYQPHLAQLQQAMGDKVQVFFGEDVYAFRFLLVAKNDYISQHPQEIQRVLRALVAAVAYIKAQPQEARHIVAQAVKIDGATLAQVFDPQDYVISLDQALLTALEDQTRWAMQRGTTPKGPMPNFLNFIRHQDLLAVKPSAVRLVH